MTLEQFKKLAQKIPDAPGVYFFLAKNKKVLYIGKATSLRDRVRSYFSKDLIHTRGPLLVNMLNKAHSIDWRQTDSVLEALLLEGSLIRSYKPDANTDSKDGKSYNHVVTTKEEFPQVLLVRGNELPYFEKKTRKVFGPYPHGLQLKEAMKLLRKIFPYRDAKCTPGQGRPCFNRQIGLCPGVCTGEISSAEYKKTIRHIELLFEGKKKQVLASLQKDMKAAVKAEDFERAVELRRQAFALQHIHDVSLIKEEYKKGPVHNRIEAYDIAHLAGSAVVGVMVVVEDGMAQKSEYRMFKIKSAKGGDDTGALREVLSRRLGHDEWPSPRIIAVDGSKAQINAAQKVLNEYGIQIPIVGVTKDERHRPRAIVGDRALIKDRERDILLANAEAHRFAITYHRKRSRKESGLR
ncbi:UvrB/UvrC motif-containing protein [Candidatus Nomurabacteria bacterium]|nr:UvrB/UvrC motif-containing protein [Candidatus Nomurabacteria bacterium]